MLDLTFRKPGSGDQLAGATAGPPVVPSVAPVSPAGSHAVGPAGASGVRGVQAAAAGDDRLMATAGLVAILIVAATGLVASFLVAQNRSSADRQTERVAALQAAQKTGETGAAFAEIQTVNRQLTIFQSFLKDAVPWPELLTALSTVVPGTLKLTNAGFTAEQLLRLDGEAKDYQTVATLLAALRESESFSDPLLTSVALNESTTGTSLTFALSVGFVPPTAAALESPEAASEAGLPAPGGPDAE